MVSDKAVGERIKALREARGLSQVQLADLSGLASPTVNRIENGMRAGRGETLKKIADALGVSTDVILSGTEEPYSKPSFEELTPQERRAISAWKRGDKTEAVKIIVNG